MTEGDEEAIQFLIDQGMDPDQAREYYAQMLEAYADEDGLDEDFDDYEPEGTE